MRSAWARGWERRAEQAGPSSRLRPSAAPIRLCVVPFKNLGNDPLQIGDSLEETVYTELAQAEGVKLVERGQIDVNIRLLDFDAKFADRATRSELGKLTGAEVALLGGYQHNDKSLRVTARFVQVQTGEILAAFKIDAPEGQALVLEERVATKARESVASMRKRLRPGSLP